MEKASNLNIKKIGIQSNEYLDKKIHKQLRILILIGGIRSTREEKSLIKYECHEKSSYSICETNNTSVKNSGNDFR